MNIPDILKQLGRPAGTVRREFAVVPRVLSEADGTIEFTASDETLDCYGEIVRVNGWRFTNFTKNSPFVNSHDYSCITQLLGKVTDWRTGMSADNKPELVETVKYIRDEGSLGAMAFKLVRDGFLKAVSVGFVPVSMCSKWDGNSAPFLAQIAELKLDPQQAAQLRAVYLAQEQIELSQCIIGANPSALAKAYKAGCLAEGELEKLSVLYAATKTATAPTSPADGAAASLRAKAAFIAGVSAHL
ncbi:MAG TPA: hypothetical protein VL357_03050 [Rariglobus sp.]|jgi:hypothetical protein|nr:hypothetical protein [Rariglobus sp.]